MICMGYLFSMDLSCLLVIICAVDILWKEEGEREGERGERGEERESLFYLF